MADTKISYVDKSWNPVVGCTKCSPGCDNCYAETLHSQRHRAYYKGKKMPEQYSKPFHEIQLLYNRLEQPLHWSKPCRILVPSMGDLFHEDVPDNFIVDVLDKVCLKYQRHQFFVLTKRIERAANIIDKYYENDLRDGYPHIHPGVTVCNQKEADEKIPILSQIPAAHRWLSIEPMLGGIDIEKPLRDIGYQWGCAGRHAHGRERLHHHHDERCKFPIDCLVVGCESGPGRRECKSEWIKSIVDQCKAAGVPVFVKQMEVNGKVVHDLKDMPGWAVQELIRKKNVLYAKKKML